MKRRIRLTESDLHRIVSRSVKRVLREGKKVNNIPWEDSQRYKDGYQAYLRNAKDWEDFRNGFYDILRRGESDEDYAKNGEDKILNSPEQRITNDWKQSNGTHSLRGIKHYQDDNEYRDPLERKNNELRRFQAQWIRDIGPEWNTFDYEQKKDELAKAKDAYYDSVEREPEDWYERNEHGDFDIY